MPSLDPPQSLLESDFWVGSYKVQPTLLQILCPDGETQRIYKKTLDVLCELAEHAGKPRTKQEILDAVWPDTHVGDDVLSNAVYELRRALNDDAKNPWAIRTLHGQGYLLLAEVRLEDPSPAKTRRSAEHRGSAPAPTDGSDTPAVSATVSAAPPAKDVDSGPRRGPRVVVALLALAVLGVLLAWHIASPPAPSPSDEAQEHYRAGLEARNRNAYADAIDSLRKALELDPEFAQAHDLLANIYDIVGHRDQAALASERAIAAAEDWRMEERLPLLRRQAQIAGHTAEELNLLKRILASDPRNNQWRFKLAWFYKTHERDCAKSEERYKDLLTASPDDPSYAYWLKYRTDHALSCGDPRRAIELLREQVERSPSPDTYDQLAYVQVLTGDYSAAEENLAAATALDPKSSMTLLLRGKLAFARGHLDEAEQAFDKYRATFEWPNFEAEAFIHLAQVHLAQGEDTAALAAAEEAVERKPWSVEALGTRGLAELRALGPGVARATLEEIERGRRETAAESLHEMEHYHYLAGAVALVEGRWSDAVRAFGVAVELHPENRATFLFALARAWQLQGENDKAGELLRQALDFNPRHAPSLCALAELDPSHIDHLPPDFLAERDCRQILTPPFVDLDPELTSRDPKGGQRP